MDYTTLIERLLDGTITADEQAELDRLMNESPDVAQEVRHLVAVERILRNTAREEEQHSFAFRESVRTGLKTSLGLGGAVAATDLNAPSPELPRRQTTTRKYTTGLLALLLLGAATLYFLIPDGSDTGTQGQSANNTPHLPSQSTPVETDKNTAAGQTDKAQPEVIQQQQPKQNSTPATAVQKAPSTERAVPLAPITPDETAQEKELSGTVQVPNGKESQYRKLIEVSVRKLQEQSTTPAVAAVTAKQIALLYEKLGDIALARQYFDTARSYARQGAVRETEGEITGEYALLEQHAGNTAKASALASESLQILRSLQSDKLNTWEKLLEPLIRSR